MYEMFTGAVPFTGDTFLGVLAKHLSDPTPQRSDICPEVAVSRSLQAVIMRVLEKDLTVRFQTMLEVAQAISASDEAAALGYRPKLQTPSEHPSLPALHVAGTPDRKS